LVLAASLVPKQSIWEQDKKYMVRHCVKPGITGLAQVSGFRGQIETDVDMINRIKLDVFYIENWVLVLDFKIIFQTVLISLKEKKSIKNGKTTCIDNYPL
jgi:putative colanic acid biosynthesis UDP-glucose lipid carrier transferase